jgi:membrane protein YdbS with pleckstrin-like domain
VAVPFENPTVDVAGLPRLDAVDFVPLHPNYLRVSMLAIGFAGVISAVVCIAMASLVERPWIPLVVLAGILALLGLAAGLRVIEVRRIAYQVRSHDVSFRHGVISRRVETLPFIRVQHVRINRGPIERQFGLATLQVNSAGPDLSIPGLPADDAERLKSLIVERAGALVEDA